jgi:hypothetical protein
VRSSENEGKVKGCETLNTASALDLNKELHNSRPEIALNEIIALIRHQAQRFLELLRCKKRHYFFDFTLNQSVKRRAEAKECIVRRTTNERISNVIGRGEEHCAECHELREINRIGHEVRVSHEEHHKLIHVLEKELGQSDKSLWWRRGQR